jgi:hypothetical protein
VVDYRFWETGVLVGWGSSTWSSVEAQFSISFDTLDVKRSICFGI